MEYVIIGNSTAGIAAVEGIRSVDKTGRITIISAEKRHCYGRPTISYYLKGDIEKNAMYYRPADFYERNGVKLMLGKIAEKIDAEARRVVLSDGENIAYDRLLVATGSRPFVPEFTGLENVKNAYGFMTYDDMLAIEKVLGKDKSVLVVGAGLIGLKCVEGIIDRVESVTVADLSDRVLSSVLDTDGAALVRAKFEEKGTKFFLGDSVSRFYENCAEMNSGKKVCFDILVIAVGVVPNTELVRNAGGECNRGIVIDRRGETSLKDVYAAGDCAEGYDSSVGKNRVLALLPNAYFQGKCAGLNMAGAENSFDCAIPMNSVGFFGLHMVSAGIYEGECVKEYDGKSYKEIFIRDNRLVGFIIIGDVSRAGIYTSLIRNKTDLSDFNLKLLLKKPSLAAFPENMRKISLSRTV